MKIVLFYLKFATLQFKFLYRVKSNYYLLYSIYLSVNVSEFVFICLANFPLISLIVNVDYSIIIGKN